MEGDWDAYALFVMNAPIIRIVFTTTFNILNADEWMESLQVQNLFPPPPKKFSKMFPFWPILTSKVLINLK